MSTAMSTARVSIVAGLGATAALIIYWYRIKRRAALRATEHVEHTGCRMPLPASHPEDVGLSPSRLRSITDWADGWVAAGKIPGMITMIARNGKLTYMHSSGLADVEQQLPFTLNTIMRFYSMTKPVTSVGAMILYERGLFQLDEPISLHLPSFASPRVLEDGKHVHARREINFRDLLMHTAGLGYGDGESDLDELYENARVGSNTPSDMSLAEFVDRLGRLPLAYHPGESWRYSYATDVLGRLIEVLSGLPLDEFLRQEVFEPLGMVDSCFYLQKEDHERRARMAQVYHAKDEWDLKVGLSAKQRRRFERSNAYLLHRLRIGDEATEASENGNGLSNPPRRVGEENGTCRTAVISAAALPGWLDTPECPMVLAPLGGEPMLIQILRQLIRGGITRAVIITGFRGAQVRDALSSHPVARQLELTFVDVGETFSDGFARSLLAAAPIVKGEDWLLYCADRFYHHDVINGMRTAPLCAPLPAEEPAAAQGEREAGSACISACISAQGEREAGSGLRKESFHAIALAEPTPGRSQHSNVGLKLGACPDGSSKWRRGSLRAVESLVSLTDDSGGDVDDTNTASTDPGALLRSHGADAMEAGLFKCSAAVFDHFEELATTLPHFSAMQVFQKVAAQGKLKAMCTGGLKWFAVDCPESLEDRSARLFRLSPTLVPAADPAAPPSTADPLQPGPAASDLKEPGSRPRLVKSLLGTSSACTSVDDDLLNATCPAKRRFYICPEEDAGDVVSGPVAFLSGGAGMLSTAHDYARFAQMLLNHGELDGRRVLSRKTIQFMTRNQLPLDGGAGSVRRLDIDAIAEDSGFNETTFDGIGFGLGWSVVQDPIKASLLCSKGEYGWGGWASTFFAIDPEENMFFMSLAQLAPSDRYPVRRQLRCLVNQTLI